MPSHETDQQLENILLTNCLLAEKDLEEAKLHAQDTGKDLATVLIDLGKVTEETIAFSIASELGLPFLQLVSEMIDKEKLKLYSAETMWRCQALPLFQGNDEILLVMSNPLNLEYRSALMDMFPENVAIHFGVGTPSAIIALLKECFKNLVASDKKPSASVEDAGEDPGAVLLVFRHLSRAFQSNAQELHFTPEGNTLGIYYRIAGKMVKQEEVPISSALAISSRLKILGGVAPGAREVPRKTIQTTLQGKSVKLHLTILPGLAAEAMSLFFEPTVKSNIFNTLPPDNPILEEIQEASQIPSGLILLANPDPIGVRSLAHHFLLSYHKNGMKAFSVEMGASDKVDPVFQIDRNLPPFSLETVLFHAPDVLYVEGNVPDALWTTTLFHRVVILPAPCLSATDALSWAVSRIPPLLLYQVLRCVFVFTTVSLLCPYCKKMASVPAALKKLDPYLPQSNIMQASGCSKCQHKGFMKEMILWDSLWVDRTLRELLSHHPSRYDIAQHIGETGNSILAQFSALIQEGKASPQDLWRYL